MIQTTAPWALSLILDVDRQAPGFCGSVLRASGERRQVIAAYLAAKPPIESEMAEVGRFLLEADHRAILAAAHGEYLTGSRGALRRVGNVIAEHRVYTLLHQLLANPELPEIRRCIAQFASVTLTKLLVARFLAKSSICHVMCRANVVEAIDDMQMGCDLETAIKLLVARGVDAEELTTAISNVRDRNDLFKAIQNFALNARAPEHPVPRSEWYLPVEDARSLHKIGLRYRNCARRFTTDLLDEASGMAFAEVRHGGLEAVVHLTRKDGQWCLESVTGPRNVPPGRALQERVERYLEREGGIRIERRQRRPKSDWDAVRRLSNTAFLDFDFD